MSIATLISTGLTEMKLSVSNEKQEKLLKYLNLLVKWNQIHNLTAIRNPEQMVYQHLLDSLATLPMLINCKTLVDVGSGGGLPGIPIAIVLPEIAVTVIDSSNKKAAFLRQVKAELELLNVEVVCARVEGWKSTEEFDVVISRAFSDLNEFAKLSEHLLTKNGKLFAMKGVYPFEEISQIVKPFQLNRVLPLKIPQLEAERHLVVLDRIM